MTSALLVALVLGQTLKLGPGGFACPAGYAIQVYTATRDKGRCVAISGGGGGSGLPADPAACPAGQFATDQNASGVLTCSAPPAQDWSAVTGKPATFPATTPVATATALAANGANCTSPQVPLGVDASGAAEGCFTPAGTYSLPDAAAAVKGGVQLAGDLGGTAASPSVVDDSHAHTGTTISALDTGDLTTGTLPQARGGTGAGALTCTGTQKLTSNGTAYSCATDADTVYSLPAATASVLGGVRGTGSSLTCAAGTVASGFDASGTLQCVTDATGGGGGGMALPYVVAAQSFGGF